MRIAVAQFAVGADVGANLAACLRVLDVAARVRPAVVVLPEFCNHPSWYENAEHCRSVALVPGGEFLSAIAAKAAAIESYVVINCTLRDGDRCTGTSLLYGPAGELLGSTDKQVLIGHENDFLSKARRAGPVFATPLGRLGLYACMDGVINETPRCLALRGAQLLCNSLNSFASDEASLHVPVRATENKVFVAAANKVGPLIPEAILEPVSRQTGIPVRFLMGAGESQIVAPDGTVLARASVDQEEVVHADIDIADANRKQRPDGSDVFGWRRPALYRPLAADPSGQHCDFRGAESVACALIQLSRTGEGAIDEAGERLAEAFASGARLASLPPLFCLAEQRIESVAQAVRLSKAAVSALARCCPPGCYVVTTLVGMWGQEECGRDARAPSAAQLAATLIGSEGVKLHQGPLHRSERYAFSPLVEQVRTADLAFGRVALLTSDDACVPEAFRLAALAGADTVVVPALPLEDWEMRTGLLERSAENRVNLLVAAQPGRFGGSFATALSEDFTVLTPWRERAFDGLLTLPPTVRAPAEPGATPVRIHPRWAANKVVSRGTDLLAGRPWHLLDPLIAPNTPAAKPPGVERQ